MDWYIVITIISSLMITAIFFIAVFKGMTLKKFAHFCLVSFISFFIGLIVIAILINIIPAYAYCTRETNAGDGIMIIAVAACFFLVSFVSELCASAIKKIAKKIRKESLIKSDYKSEK